MYLHGEIYLHRINRLATVFPGVAPKYPCDVHLLAALAMLKLSLRSHHPILISHEKAGTPIRSRVPSDRNKFTVDEISDLYRFRWEIETLFDEAKNECTLGDIKVKREEATMTLLLAMLIRQVILRRVYLVLRTLLGEATRQKLSPKLYGRAFIEQMDLLLEILAGEGKPPGEQVRGGDGWGLWFERLSRNSLQYHPKKLGRPSITTAGTRPMAR